MKFKEVLSSVEYIDKELEKKAQKEAEKKFGSKNSYVKNLYKLNWYRKNGGKVKYSGDKPSDKSVKESVSAAKQPALNKPFRTPNGPKKFAVYVKNDKGNVVLVRFGDPNMEIKRDDPARRRNFRARHNCDNPGPKWKARYWACYTWSERSVTDIVSGSSDEQQIDFDNVPTQEELYGLELPHFDIEEVESVCEDCV